ISSPTSSRKPKAPQKPSTPAPGYMAKCVEEPPTLLTPLTNPVETLALEVLKFTNPTLPVTNARTGLDAPNWNFGPNKAVSGRKLVRTNVEVPPVEVTVVKLRSKS